MADKPVSPFAGLDKALLRSTQHLAEPPAPPPEAPPSTPTPEAAAEQPVRKSVNTQIRKDVKTLLRKERASLAAATAPTSSPLQDLEFDILNELSSRETAWFSADEVAALEDLKQEFRRKHDMRASKIDLLRCGLYALVDDYRRNGETSIVYRHIARRRSKS